MTSDRSIRDQISVLVAEEHALRNQEQSHENDPGDARTRLRHIEGQLDQCWDLLRQRQALREFGSDPDSASARPISTVEAYRG